MRLKNVVAAMLVVGGTSITLAATLATAAPAMADPSTDQQFLNGIKNQGLSLKSDSFAIDLAHSTCDVLSHGSVTNALQHVKSGTGWTSTDQIVKFGSLAVQAYCPALMPKS